MIPSSLKKLVRAPYRRVKYEIQRRREPLIPPPWLHSVGTRDADFRQVGRDLVRLFRELAGLNPTDRVLDVGSGVGRVTVALHQYLTTGTYDGIEIVKPSVDWCRSAYAKYPNFRFHHADLYNKRYNRTGAKAADYRFPFADKSFDFIFLTSVFTHMLPADVANYLREISRTIDDDGRVFATAFLLNERPRPNPAHTFTYDLGDGAWADDHEVPELATAYEEPVLVKMIEDAGLKVSSTHYGSWRGSDGLSWQDILILERRGHENSLQSSARPG